ncbi:MAG: aspartyl protease family protein [Acidobacteria bacterium]|nr:aspartyl protease family protein [Acidobacteriota bacterium]
MTGGRAGSHRGASAVIALALAGAILAAAAADPDPNAPAGAPAPPPPDPVAVAQKLLDADRWQEALDAARGIVAAHPESAAAGTLLADALYRRGDFEEAEAAYRAAAAADPNFAPAQFGIGRILRTVGHYGDAAESFHRAAALDPNNPRYVRTLSNHLAKREDVIRLLTHYLDMPPVEGEGVINNVRAWIELLKELRDEPLGEIVTSDPTDLPLNVLRGQAYLKADVNTAAGQRFAFDTGATGLTISPRLAKLAKVKTIRPFTVTGMGGKGVVDGDLVLIKSLKLGGVSIRNVSATIAEPRGDEEGLFGPPILGSFLIRVDLDPGTLGLRLNDGKPDAPKPAGSAPAPLAIPFRNVGGQIFVKASLNGTPLNAMVDTGASSSLATMSAAPRVPGLELLPGDWVQGRSVGLAGSLARKALREATLSFGGVDFKADRMPCVDLARFSRALESEVYLVIGFPELARFVTEIDYRTNTLTLTPKAK